MWSGTLESQLWSSSIILYNNNIITHKHRTNNNLHIYISTNKGDYSHSKLAPSRWYEEVTSNLESAVLYNEETVAAVKKAREKFGAIGAKLLKDVHEKKIQAEEEGMRTPPPEPTMLVSGDPIQMIQLQLIWLIWYGQTFTRACSYTYAYAYAYTCAYTCTKSIFSSPL